MNSSRRTWLTTGTAAFACLVALTLAIDSTASGSHTAIAASTISPSSLNVPSTGSFDNGPGSASGDGSGSLDNGSGSASGDGSGSFDDGSGSFDNGSGSLDNGSGSAPSVDPGNASPTSGTS